MNIPEANIYDKKQKWNLQDSQCHKIHIWLYFGDHFIEGVVRSIAHIL